MGLAQAEADGLQSAALTQRQNGLAELLRIARVDADVQLARTQGDAAVEWVTSLALANKAYASATSTATVMDAIAQAQAHLTWLQAEAQKGSAESVADGERQATRLTQSALLTKQRDYQWAAAQATFFSAQASGGQQSTASLVAQLRQAAAVTSVSATGGGVTGTVLASGVPGFVPVEIDENSDGTVDAIVLANATGTFAYSTLATGTLKARTNLSGVVSNWVTVTLNATQPGSGTYVSRFGVADFGDGVLDAPIITGEVSGVTAPVEV